jgi:hypothetical protein
MPLPSVDQFLSKLDADPQAGRDFDAATRAERPHCKTRREACEHLLASLRAKTASVTASNEKKRQALLAQRELEKAAAAMLNRRKTAPISKAPAPAPTAAAETAREKYQRLQKTAPNEAGKFWDENKADILWPNRITKSYF